MNNEKLIQSIEYIDVPLEKVIAREKAAIYKAKKRKKVGRTAKQSILIACGLCMTILGSGFVSTGMAAVLSKIPLLSPIYKEFGDIASDKIEQDQLATVIEKQDSHDGLTMTVKEAVYDGGRLVVTVMYTGDKDLSLKDEESVGFHYVTINGQEVTPAIGSSGQDEIDPKTIIESNQFTLSNIDEYGDKIEVAVHGEDLYGHKGEWQVAFPLEKIKGEIHQLQPGVKAETADKVYALTADKVTFSPLSTRIDLTVDYPAEMDAKDTWPWFNFSVVDDQGQVYDRLNLQQGFVYENNRYNTHQMVLTLPPMEVLPKSFTLMPGYPNNEGYRDEIKELQLVIPVDKKK